MKIKHLFYAAAIGLLTVGCTDELPVVPEMTSYAESSDELRDEIGSTYILYRGESELMETGISDKICYQLYRFVENESDSDISFEYEGEKIYLKESEDFGFSQEGTTLVTSRIPEDADFFYIAAFWLEGNMQDWYPVFFSIRDNQTKAATKAEEAQTAEEKRMVRAAQDMSNPVVFGNMPAVDAQHSWLDKFQLGGKVLKDGTVLPPVINTVSNLQKNTYVSEGSTKTTKERSLAVNVGFGLRLPIFKSEDSPMDIILGATVNVNDTKRWHSETEREWITYSIKTNGMHAALTDQIISRSSLYIHPELNDCLNQPNSVQSTTMYPLTLDGTMKLLDAYGLFLSRRATYGCSVDYSYERNANVSTYDRATDVAVNINLGAYSQKDPTKKPTIEEVAMLYVLTKAGVPMSVADFTLGVGVKETVSDYFKAVEAKTEINVYGGNLNSESDVEKWVPTDDPQNWVITYFDAPTATTLSSDYLTLIDLCTDKQSARAKLLKQALYLNPDNPKTFLDPKCPYVEYLRSKYVAPTVSKTVVADVKLVSGGFSDSPKPFVSTELDGKTKLLYVPLVLNGNGGDMVNGWGGHNLMGYGAQFGCDSDEYEGYYDFIAYGDHSKDWGNKTICLYYAMADYKAVAGLEDVILVDSGQPHGNGLDGYVRRGVDLKDVWKNRSERECCWCSVYCKYVPKSKRTLNFPYITGIALVAGQTRKGYSNWEPGYPIASSMGMEWNLADGDTKEVCDFYWKVDQAKKVYTSVFRYKDNKVYTCGINNDSPAKTSSHTAYYIKSVYDYFGPIAHSDNTVYWKDAEGNEYSEKRLPAMFYCLRNDDPDSHEDTNACIFLEYTIRQIDTSMVSPVAPAKLLPWKN